jgi:hypothetical protein
LLYCCALASSTTRLLKIPVIEDKSISAPSTHNLTFNDNL